ncbi:hypothetical protein FFI94_028930 [Rhodococcus sp. KBS0724]|nr:hypothetical protein FFI94_028930 [Rhodococcus sp. KBS0724]
MRPCLKSRYVDVEDIADAMVLRFEFEIDTTRAVQSREAERLNDDELERRIRCAGGRFRRRRRHRRLHGGP